MMLVEGMQVCHNQRADGVLTTPASALTTARGNLAMASSHDTCTSVESQTPYWLVASVLSYDSLTGVFTWKATRGGTARAGSRAGCINKRGYRQISIGDRLYLEHRLAWLLHYGSWPSSRIDHRDRCRDHNWIANLRLATSQENARNGSGYRGGGTSDFRGVSWDKATRKWKAGFKLCGKRKHLGRFASEIDAALAYDAAVRQHYGEFASVNFPMAVAP